ncbi:NAD(P)/FAD-dependent oxidoreductase [Paenibacillus rhizophilus]|uniref:NAD(P)/FAD-dependent oxidoreductase n=1 Tax=Paenibacillus rhizophilus TaxID=1850366 RepID=A0A3N9Q004_9BACL|nr:NAD(P)/FAD-dependent oxidoreductase [Paenibacillus rhizophilus]RQW10796.1 NAD(P)/FAD-dependent oxidoreductase [Paenibacillus rhizophilus]
MTYDTIIIGGGIAGLQAAIQLGRYSAHQVLVIDAAQGRSSLCRSYHNILGWPDGISGEELRARGKLQAARAGVEFVSDKVLRASKRAGLFYLEGSGGTKYTAKTLLLATGIMDRFPELPGLRETLGRSVYVCPDCDGYEIQDRSTVLIGSGISGLNMAFILRQRTPHLTYINHEKNALSPKQRDHLEAQGIIYIEEAIARLESGEDGMIRGVTLENGRTVSAERGFIAMGGNSVHSELAEQLGVELHKNRHIEANRRSLMTNVEGVWAAGDVAVHAEQATVAMGDGAIAAIWIHKTLQKMKQTVPLHLS